MTFPGKGYQTPRRESGPSRSQEAAPGTLAPSSLPAAPTAAAVATAPSPTRRRGPGALFRDKRRRLTSSRTSFIHTPTPAAWRQDAATHEAAPSPLLAPSERIGAPALPRPRPIVILPPRKTTAAPAPTIPSPPAASAPDPPRRCNPGTGSSSESDGNLSWIPQLDDLHAPEAPSPPTPMTLAQTYMAPESDDLHSPEAVRRPPRPRGTALWGKAPENLKLAGK